jgi:hypothetical protein
MDVYAKPFDNADVRMALKYAIDRDDIVKKIFLGHGTVGNDNPIAPVVKFAIDTMPKHSYDPDKAKSYLKKAGLSSLKVDLSVASNATTGARAVTVKNADGSSATLNAANEVAVAAFIGGQIGFGGIADLVEATPKPVGEAPYVTFVQDSQALGLSPPATWIRIPWTPQMANITFMMSLRMQVGGIIKPRQLHWYESAFTGERYQFSLSYNEVRDRPIFPMYAELRGRAIHLADAPAELVVHFTHSDHLRIEQVYPPTSIRRLSEILESTEVVSLFMGSADGITPQHMTVQFGYFSRLQGLMIVLIPLLLLAAGPALGPAIGRAMPGVWGWVRARMHLGTSQASPRARGIILSPEMLDRIVPGKTSREDVLKMFGKEVEEEERREPHALILPS